MRKKFEQQPELDADLIPDIKINSKSRSALPKLLAGLQYIFITPELNRAIFRILEKHILKKKNKMGCPGMTLWEIFVLGAIRLNMDIDYDMLQDQADNHDTIRGIMGIRNHGFFGSGKRYPLQTLKDNVGLLTEDCLSEINEVVVKSGHKLLKKNQEETVLNIKVDTYPVESNIHFPTDLNLLWDSARKCLDMICALQKNEKLNGWRKHEVWREKAKKYYRRTSNIHQRKGKNYLCRLQAATRAYLDNCRKLEDKVILTMVELEGSCDIRIIGLLEELSYYLRMLKKHIDLVDRRIMKGEEIPHADKVFSIFEPHVEWIRKGKPHNKVDLGHNVLITTCQFHFILDHKVLVGEGDAAQPIPLAKRLVTRFSEGYRLGSISFDRGFYSKLAKKAMKKKFKHVSMPSKGPLNKEEREEKKDKTLAALAKKHSAVESNINELEHSGANKVPDKGLPGFKKYVAQAVLAYNIKRLGRIAIEKELVNLIPKPKRRKKAA